MEKNAVPNAFEDAGKKGSASQLVSYLPYG